MPARFQRRRFLQASLAAAGGIVILRDSRSVAAYPANEKLRIAIIGVCGQGGSNAKQMAGENVVALCDVNEKNLAAAAKELNALRESWLNPPEWTRTEVLEFPGTVGGPWHRYIDPATVTDRGAFKVGTVRYPRLVARDADCAARLKDRTLTKLYNERPAWLADCHARLDAAVAAAYGWPADLTDEAILERLLALNQAAPI